MANGSVRAARVAANDGGAMTCVPAQSDDLAISADGAGTVDVITEVRREEALLKTGALQNAIFNRDRKSVV